MCWSAEADLVAGAVVAGLGVWCLARVRRPRDLPLAALPLVLGAHQLAEAAVWSGGPASWALTAWAVIALPLLPVLVPLGVWCALGRGAGFAVLGLAVAVPLAVAVAARPVTAETHGHTLRYGVGIPYAPLLLAGYLVATVGSLLVSGDRLLRLLGVLVGVGAVVCGLLYQLAFASTWCALAALASLVLLRWTGRPEPTGRTPGPGPADRA
ncbi:hypothetical protein GCM10009760_50680 [Kitasatospora kazusensis]|uniref:Integral membrane protein n=1 Tax=Kitasatospora kazusensis TaxID=407974 RepID=A0ABP5LX01_9ACTN